MDWICAKCHLPLEEVKDIQMVYSRVTLPKVSGVRCPGCGVELLDKQVILSDVVQAEMLLNGK